MRKLSFILPYNTLLAALIRVSEQEKGRDKFWARVEWGGRDLWVRANENSEYIFIDFDSRAAETSDDIFGRDWKDEDYIQI